MKFQIVRFLRLFLFMSIFFNERYAFLVCVGTYLLINFTHGDFHQNSKRSQRTYHLMNNYDATIWQALNKYHLPTPTYKTYFS